MNPSFFSSIPTLSDHCYNFCLKLQRFLLLFVIVQWTILGSETLSPDGYLLDEIQVVGCTASAQEKIKEIIKEIPEFPTKGDYIQLSDPSLLQTAVKKLYKQGYSVSIEQLPSKKRGYINLYVHVIDQMPCLYKITWEGINEKKDKELLDQIALQPGAPVTAYGIKKTEKHIHAYFAEKGFPNVHIKTAQTNTPNGMALRFTITGLKEKIYVSKVVFKGNKQLRRLQLPYTKSAIQNLQKLASLLLKSMQELDLVTSADYIKRYFSSNVVFVARILQQELIELKQKYQSLGFLDVKITYQLTQSKDHVDVLITIQEGARYKIAKILWQWRDGQACCTNRALDRAVGKKVGACYNPFFWAGLSSPAAARVNDLLHEKNYILRFFHTKIKHIDTRQKTVILQVHIAQGPIPILHKIWINKDAGIDRSIVQHHLAEFGIVKGDPIHSKQVERAEQGFRFYPVYDPTKTRFHLIPQSPRRAILDCSLSAQVKYDGNIQFDPPHAVELEGYMTNFAVQKLLKGRKPYGSGQDLRIAFLTEKSLRRMQGKLQIKNMYVADMKTGVAVVSRQNRNSTMHQHDYSLAVEMGRTRCQKTHHLHHSIAFGPISRKWTGSHQVNQLVISGYLKKESLGLVSDRPKGNVIQYRQKIAWDLMGKDKNYWQGIVAYEKHVPVSNTTFQLKLDGGLGITLGSEMGQFCFTEQRKFAPNPLSLHQVELRGYRNPQGDKYNLPIATSPAYIKAGLVLRRPINKNLSIDIFANVGYPFEAKYCASMGMGFHLKTPIGPIMFDLGWQTDRPKLTPSLQVYMEKAPDISQGILAS